MRISAPAAFIGAAVVAAIAVGGAVLSSTRGHASTNTSRTLAANACTEYEQAAFLHNGVPADVGSKTLHLNRALTLAKQAAAADSRWANLSSDIGSYTDSIHGGAGPATNFQEFAASLKSVQAECSAAGVDLHGS